MYQRTHTGHSVLLNRGGWAVLGVLLGGMLAPAHAEYGFTSAATLNTNAGSDSGIDYWPFIATDGSGNWVTVWYSGESLGGTVGTDWDILFARSTDNGATWSAPAALNSNAASDSGSDINPHVKYDGAGNWIAVWSSNDSLGGTTGTDDDILFARSTDGGATWSPPAPLNSSASTDESFEEDIDPDIAPDGAGNWIAVWSSTNDLDATVGADEDIFFARSTDNGATWTALTCLNDYASYDGKDDRSPRIATDGAGNWVVTWESRVDNGVYGTDWDIFFSRSTDNGATWTTSAPLNSNATTDSGADEKPMLETDGSGNWIAIWSSTDSLGSTIGTDYDILFARSTDNGATWTAPTALNTSAPTDSSDFDYSPRIAPDGMGNWMAVWQSTNTLGTKIDIDRDILAARSTDNGITWTAPAPVSANATTDSGSDQYPAIATDGTGNWVVTWHSNETFSGFLGTDNDIFVSRSSNISLPVELDTFTVQ
ncbi:MAG: hypothetical protein PWP23_1189 [Candidatus Sumerlaeota bacterium]|nr:hypothetical protein [Candidatus Sumerlaeota bacterium]